jgi:ribonuclease H2 subunit A
MIGFLADDISASFISGGMLGCQKVSLNAMANESTYKLIRSVLDAGVLLHEVYVDTVGDADIYKQKLSREFPGIQFTVCPKADALYPIVSAASIVAKVQRDRSIINNKGLVDVGSGYPGDPATKAWLEANINNIFGYSNDVRFSWSTCVTLMEKHCIKVDWEADDDSPGGQPSLAAMMSGGAGKKMRPRHSYFRARKLQKVIAGW